MLIEYAPAQQSCLEAVIMKYNKCFCVLTAATLVNFVVLINRGPIKSTPNACSLMFSAVVSAQ